MNKKRYFLLNPLQTLDKWVSGYWLLVRGTVNRKP